MAIPTSRPLPPAPICPLTPADRERMLTSALGLLFHAAQRHWPNVEIRAAIAGNDLPRLLREAERWIEAIPDSRERDELIWAITILRPARDE